MGRRLVLSGKLLFSVLKKNSRINCHRFDITSKSVVEYIQIFIFNQGSNSKASQKAVFVIETWYA